MVMHGGSGGVNVLWEINLKGSGGEHPKQLGAQNLLNHNRSALC